MRLTPIQKERLLNRDNPEFANVKRSNDYLVREAFKDFLNLEDVNLILKTLPKNQIEKVLTWDQIDNLLELAERLCDFLGPGDEPHYEVPLELQPLFPILKTKPDVVKVSETDQYRANRLKRHINKLNEEKETREMFYNTFLNLEKMASQGLKVPYKKKTRFKKYMDAEERELEKLGMPTDYEIRKAMEEPPK
jgi:hypothetical protein